MVTESTKRPRRNRFTRLAATVIGVLALWAAGFVAWAWYPTIPAITPPDPASFDAAAVKRGEFVANAGFCAECHTRKGGAEFAGNYPMDTGFGTIYASNITPDAQTGIGTWSKKAFRRALHEGVARDGHYLFPAFPYDHFTKMTDKDVSDLYAYMMTRPAVTEKTRPVGIPFPLNIRFLQAGWKLLFVHTGRYTPDQTQDTEWNRGAYLAEGAAHCGACHTPRNALGAEEKGHRYDGAVVDGWIAPALNAHNPTPVAWTETELFSYLRYGVAPLHGSAAGPMNPIPHRFLSNIPEDDVKAIAHYYASVDQAAARTKGDTAAIAAAMKRSATNLVGPTVDPDAKLYQAACAACHYNGGDKPVLGRPELALNNALWLDEPTNLFMVMLRGISASEGQSAIAMPSFYDGLSDKDMARLAAYLRRTRTTLPPWKDLEKKAADARASLKAPPINASH